MMLKKNIFLGITEPERKVVIKQLLPSLIWLVSSHMLSQNSNLSSSYFFI